MEEIKVTSTYHWSPADIKARLTDDGKIEIWFEYKDINQQRHEISFTPEEWNRLVAWVEWQRKDKKR
jgi:hypothetical protein